MLTLTGRTDCGDRYCDVRLCELESAAESK